MTDEELRIQAVRLAIEAKATDVPAEAERILAFLRPAPETPEKVRRGRAELSAAIERACAMMTDGATRVAAARACGWRTVTSMYESFHRRGATMPPPKMSNARSRNGVAAAARMNAARTAKHARAN